MASKKVSFQGSQEYEEWCDQDYDAKHTKEEIAQSLRWYDKEAFKREELVDKAKGEAGEPTFEPGASLRITWAAAQRMDKDLMHMFRAPTGSSEKGATPKLAEGYRIAADGVLERLVPQPAPAHTKWVPIVPEGYATCHFTWKRWIFLQCHVGILGAHRSAEKTVSYTHLTLPTKRIV